MTDDERDKVTAFIVATLLVMDLDQFAGAVPAEDLRRLAEHARNAWLLAATSVRSPPSPHDEVVAYLEGKYGSQP